MFTNIFNNAGGEIIFIYGLIGLVIVLIITMIVLDKLDNKKKRKSLSDTLSLKPIEDPANFKSEKKKEIEVIEFSTDLDKEEFDEVIPVPREEVSEYNRKEVENVEFQEDDDDYYVPEEIEKTQAQIRVEEITQALKDAKVDEKIELDRYEEFEKEQEKNAIISYKELKEEYDKLYEENEKRQYLEDDEIPINISELYELNRKEEEKLEHHVEETKKEELNNFRSTPYISPVYGIQNNKR